MTVVTISMKNEIPYSKSCVSINDPTDQYG